MIVDTLSARSCEISWLVHTGCVGIEISIPVILAAKRSPSRRGDCWRETAMTAPNWWSDLSALACVRAGTCCLPTPSVALAGSRVASGGLCSFKPAKEAACFARCRTAPSWPKSRYSTSVSTKMIKTSSIRCCSLVSILTDCRFGLSGSIQFKRWQVFRDPKVTINRGDGDWAYG